MKVVLSIILSSILLVGCGSRCKDTRSIEEMKKDYAAARTAIHNGNDTLRKG